MAVSSEVKLSIYNGALRRLGSRKLASLDEARKPRRVLDDIWGPADEVVYAALERGEWNFAIRAVEAFYSPDIEPDFGFTYAFPRPDDFRRLAALSGDPQFQSPLTNSEYLDEANFWFSDLQIIYIRYVSDDTDYGLNSGGWTEVFKEYLEARMAWEACEQITNSTAKRDRLDREMGLALKAAKSHDAMNEGVKFPPRGSWSRARGVSKRGPQG